MSLLLFFLQAEDSIRYGHVTGVQPCALPFSPTTRPTGRDTGPVPPPQTGRSAVRQQRSPCPPTGRLACPLAPRCSDALFTTANLQYSLAPSCRDGVVRPASPCCTDRRIGCINKACCGNSSQGCCSIRWSLRR